MGNVEMTEEKCTEETRLTREACAYLLANLGRRVTIAELAERLSVSQTRLKTSFRACCGMSIHSYVRQEKMALAARLLRESDESVLTIAGQVGYENGSKFAQVFRQVMGVSPMGYRRGQRRAEREERA